MTCTLTPTLHDGTAGELTFERLADRETFSVVVRTLRKKLEKARRAAPVEMTSRRQDQADMVWSRAEDIEAYLGLATLACERRGPNPWIIAATPLPPVAAKAA